MEEGVALKAISLEQENFGCVIEDLRTRITESGKFFEHDAQNGVYLFRLKSLGMTERDWREKLFAGLFYACECLSSILSDDFRPKFNKVYEIVVIEKDSPFSKKRSLSALYNLSKPFGASLMPKEAIILLLHFLALPENHNIDLPFITIVKGILKDSNICHDVMVANFEKYRDSKSIAFQLASGLDAKNWQHFGNIALWLES